jgi:hypothetical protein
MLPASPVAWELSDPNLDILQVKQSHQETNAQVDGRTTVEAWLMGRGGKYQKKRGL